MKTPRNDLTADQVKKILRCDAEAGKLYWLDREGVEAGSVNKLGYRSVSIKRRPYLAHRLIWLCHYGSWPKHFIDHINGNPRDNRLSNLRDVTHTQNMQNRPTARGYRRSGRGYEAIIVRNKRRKSLGTFLTQEEASAAYLSARARLDAR